MKDVHQQNGRYAYKHPDCAASFSKPGRLVNHIRDKHLQIYKYLCTEDDCGKGIHYKKGLENSINVVHVQGYLYCKNANVGCPFKSLRAGVLFTYKQAYCDFTSDAEKDRHFHQCPIADCEENTAVGTNVKSTFAACTTFATRATLP